MREMLLRATHLWERGSTKPRLPSVSLNRPAPSLPSQRSQQVTEVIDVMTVGHARTRPDAAMRVEAKGARLPRLVSPYSPTHDWPPLFDQETHEKGEAHRKRKEAKEALLAIGLGGEENGEQPQGY